MGFGAPFIRIFGKQKTPVPRRHEGFLSSKFVISRPGSDLLSHVLRRSTIGAEDINGRVRDGIGFGVLAITTGPANNKQRSWFELSVIFQSPNA